MQKSLKKKVYFTSDAITQEIYTTSKRLFFSQKENQTVYTVGTCPPPF